MDFSSIIDILFVIGAIALGFFPGIKKLLGEEKGPKKVVRPIIQESEEEPEVQPERKRSAPKSAPAPSQNEEYFSYETMSERDFEQAFSENVEENKHFAAAAETPHPDIHLNMDEEEIYKGVVWSEILNRKY